MSKLCLGTVQFGMKYGVNNALRRQPDRQECYDIIEKALQAGITTFDTASAYGTAESLLGGFPWESRMPCVISKLPPECPDDESVVVEKIQESLQKLNMSGLYGYLLHRGSDMDRKSVMSGLSAVKEQGLVEKIGVSIYEPEEAMQAVNNPVIDIIQIPHNVLDKRLDQSGFFMKAKENHKEIYARSAFLQGLLLMKPTEAEARVAQSGKLVAEFQGVAQEYGFSSAEAAMLYSLYHKGIDYVVFGVETVEQLQDNLSVQEKLEGFGNCYKALSSMFMNVPREILVPSLWR